jgi:NADH-quinone oxidoreductase subunit H
MAQFLYSIWQFIYNPFPVLGDLLSGFLSSFLPGWLAAIVLSLLGAVLVMSVVPAIVMGQIYMERRLLARAQDRIGPNRVGPFGLLQPVADALKLLAKEDILPTRADKLLFTIAPILVLSPSLLIWAVIPFGPGLQVADINVAVLFIVATAGLPTIGFIMAGWSSNNKYALFGGMRAVAQFISYELPGVLALVTPVLLAGSMSLPDIVQAQLGQNAFGPLPGWFVFYLPFGPIALFLFLVSGLAETNRTPFDLVEAESELGAGFHTEYSGMRFALFFLAEYANMFAVSLIATALFLGGWDGWFLPVPPYLVMIGKAQLLVFLMMWIRGTLPRLRYDQLMHYAWKRLLPLSLANIGLTGLAIAIAQGMVGF